MLYVQINIIYCLFEEWRTLLRSLDSMMEQVFDNVPRHILQMNQWHSIDDGKREKEDWKTAEKGEVHFRRGIKHREVCPTLRLPDAVAGLVPLLGVAAGQGVRQRVQVGRHVTVEEPPDLPDCLYLHSQEDDGVFKQSTWKWKRC